MLWEGGVLFFENQKLQYVLHGKKRFQYVLHGEKRFQYVLHGEKRFQYVLYGGFALGGCVRCDKCPK